MARTGQLWIDGEELSVKLPCGHEWPVDRGRLLNISKPSRKFPQWTRKGMPPNITATPSINCKGCYHGWLQDGILSDDIEGRSFEG